MIDLVLEYFRQDPLKLLYLIGGSGGLWYWFTQWRDRTRIRVRLLGETYNLKREPDLEVNLVVEVVNLGSSVTSLEPYVVVSGLNPKREPRSFSLEIQGSDRTLAPHHPKQVRATGTCNPVYPFLWYKKYSFVLTRGTSGRLYLRNASNFVLGTARFLLEKLRFRLGQAPGETHVVRETPEAVRVAVARTQALELRFQPEPPFEVRHPLHVSGRLLRGYRIEVLNTGDTDLSGCLVKLEHMTDSQTQTYRNAFVPVGLRTQHQSLQQRAGGTFNLRVGEHKFIEVAYLNEAEQNSEILLQYETDQYVNRVPRGDYQLTISVYGGGPAVTGKYRMFVDREGYFRFEEMAI